MKKLCSLLYLMKTLKTLLSAVVSDLADASTMCAARQPMFTSFGAKKPNSEPENSEFYIRYAPAAVSQIPRTHGTGGDYR